MQNHKETLAVCDANILIDYVTADEAIIKELCTYWKKVLVPDFVLHEVKLISADKAEQLGLTIIETPLLDLQRLPGLSLQDSACLYFVRENHAVCLSNDVKLRAMCIKENVETVWGLEMLLFLVKEKQITKTRAKNIARGIHKINALIIIDVLSDFMEKMKKS
ncbi:MAG: hypothetical protein JW904_05245 [Spirochaetales bacterium]|nr:hypothetical protein [Spirochaetales bacterium]